ncbi:hypothetical protein SAMN05443549_101263 [Flavobacterium fluvii]|uniref:Uncharacterized protein n=1 Tax=Flavobacterium fluvii TaxID=468056 RepID=A0A1M5EAR8_9FLAO|nr:hypothetical protein SAMN05443549_101263 [Flavobacterium fluvii]
MLSCTVLKFIISIKIETVFSLEFVTNTPKIIIGGTATNELDLYENKTTAAIEEHEKK